MSFSYLMKSSNRYQYNPKIFLEKLNYFPGETIKINIGFSSNGNINLKENPLKINYSIKQIEYWDNNNNINIIEKSNLNGKTISYDSNTPGNPSDFNQRIKEDYIKDKKSYKEEIVLNEELYITDFSYEENIMDSFNKDNDLSIYVKISLPKDMKPSFEWNKNKEINIYCYSRTILTLNIPDLKLVAKYYLFIKKDCPGNIKPINIKTNIGKEPFIFLFFWDNDYINFNILSNKDALPLGDNLPININIDSSKLKSELYSINITLKRKIKFMINRNQSILDNTCDFIEDLWEEKVNLNKNITQYNLKFNIPLKDNEISILKKTINFNINSQNISKKYLTYLMPSYDGDNIRCEYFLKIRPKMDSSVDFNDVIIPIKLYHLVGKNNGAINEIDKILIEVNDNFLYNDINKNNNKDIKIKINKINKDNNNIINNNNIIINNYDSNYSLPDEDMIKGYYEKNKQKMSYFK